MLLIIIAAAQLGNAFNTKRLSNAGCTAVSAEYRSYSNPSYRLSFRRVWDKTGLPSELAILIREKKANSQMWYYFDEGSAQRISLISTNDPTIRGWRADPDGGVRPHGPATYVAMDKNGFISSFAPKSSTKAPYFIIIPELAETLRNGRVKFSPSAFLFSRCTIK